MTKSFWSMMLVITVCLFFSACGNGPGQETREEVPSTEENVTKTETEYVPSGRFTDDPSAMEKAAGSVVKLETFDLNGNRIATGSGFAAIDEGILITACHVIVNMDHLTATTDAGETFTIEKAIEADRNKDIAVLLLPEGTRLPLLPVSGSTLLRGEKTAVIGSQFGVRNLVTTGNYCGSWNTEGTDWLLFTAPVSGGSSGAPLFNDLGEVIGVVAGTYEDGQNFNIATPISSVQDMYENQSEDAEK